MQIGEHHGMNQNRWEWCDDCWRWEDSQLEQGTHTCMGPIGEQEPSEHNFEGTPEELAAFKAEWLANHHKDKPQ